MFSLQLILLLLLFTTFLAIVIWVFRPNSKKYYENLSNIPLKEDKEELNHDQKNKKAK